jgi:hypothetical protein
MYPAASRGSTLPSHVPRAEIAIDRAPSFETSERAEAIPSRKRAGPGQYAPCGVFLIIEIICTIHRTPIGWSLNDSVITTSPTRREDLANFDFAAVSNSAPAAITIADAAPPPISPVSFAPYPIASTLIVCSGSRASETSGTILCIQFNDWTIDPSPFDIPVRLRHSKFLAICHTIVVNNATNISRRFLRERIAL